MQSCFQVIGVYLKLLAAEAKRVRLVLVIMLLLESEDPLI